MSDESKEGIGQKIKRVLKRIFASMFSKESKEIQSKQSEMKPKKSKTKVSPKKRAKQTKKEPMQKRSRKIIKKQAEVKKAENEEKKEINESDYKRQETSLKRESRKELRKAFFKKKKEKKVKKEKSLISLATERAKILNSDIDKEFSEWELLFHNINLASEIIGKIKEKVYQDLGGRDIKIEKIEKRINFAMRDAISSMIQPQSDLIKQIKSASDPFVILFMGPAGSGKTRSLVKVGRWLQKKDVLSILAASDTTSSQAASELEDYAKKLDLPLTKAKAGSEPALVALEAKKYAKEQGIKCVLIDTAWDGSSNAAKEIKKIISTVKPNIKLFIGKSTKDDSTLQQAIYFNKEFGIDGVIISKTDIYDEKSTVLTLSYSIKKPIYFLGTGSEPDNLIPFEKEAILKKLKLG